ncbi:MAG: hypothetical protein GX039_00735 [Clostridia bacterium]|nr:hypothetical protein [Clostridia bacterium]
MSEQISDQGRQQQVAAQPKRPGSLLDWILGLMFAVTGAIGLFIKPKAAVLMLVLAAVILPLSSRYLENKLPFKLSTPVKLLVIAAVMYIFSNFIK